MYACNGILFNHESPDCAGETFVTRKITRGWRASRWACRRTALPGQPRCEARLGPCPGLHRDAVADAAAGEAAGFRHRNRSSAVQRARLSFSVARICWNCGFTWQGSAAYRTKRRVDKPTGNVVVAIDPRYFRPTEVETLLGDPTKAQNANSDGRRPPPLSELVHGDGGRGSQVRSARCSGARARL